MSRTRSNARCGAAVLAVLAALSGFAQAGPDAAPPAEELLKLGERIYIEGLSADGQPITALVAGDVQVDGSQFTCVRCHRRSGMGSSENVLIASMVTEGSLYAPLSSGQRRRPAYTDESLAYAMREGIDPAGQPFDAAMPKYQLTDLEMRALIAYMKSLSREVSPGVSEGEIHFATVVTGDAPASGMLAMLERLFEEKNRETRDEVRRSEYGPYYRDNMNEAYRKWRLHVWTLRGAEPTWRAQLERYYAKRPVFATISGMSTTGWQPVHEFCEEHRIPCILPNTDRPVVAPDTYYSLYFSEGVVLEARTVAALLSRDEASPTVVQLFREDGNGATAAAALRRQAADREGFELRDLTVRTRADLEDPALVARLDRADAAVLWLGEHDLAVLAPRLRGLTEPPALYVSSTQLGGEVAALPGSLPETARLLHPYSLPEEFNRAFRRVEIWLRHRGIEIDDPRVLAQTYFAYAVVAEVLRHARWDYFYRDYFLESIDMLTEVTRASASHPLPSFGPGQRYISKGCYVVDPGRPTADKAEWVVP